MSNLNLAQDVANERKKKLDSCPYCGQIVFPIASSKNAHRYGSLFNINTCA